MFCDRMDVEKPKRVPLSVFRHCQTFFLKFFSLQRVPLQFFDILQQNGCLKIRKGPPFCFSALRLFFENMFFRETGPPSTATKILTLSEVSPRSVLHHHRPPPPPPEVAPFSVPGARVSGPRRATRSTFLVFRFSRTVN